MRLCCLLALGLWLSSCSRVPPADDGFVTSTVETRIGASSEWRKESCKDLEVCSYIENALKSEMTPDLAIQIALLNNPKIQAIFEELGIAQANLIEAGLFTNPLFDFVSRYPSKARLHPNIEYALTTSLLDAFLIPLRTKLAETEFELTKRRVAQEILDLAFDVRSCYYELVFEHMHLNYSERVVKLSEIQRDLALQQASVGNVNLLYTQLSQSKFLEDQLKTQHLRLEIISLKEKFNRFLGLSCDVCLNFPDPISTEWQCPGFDLCELETLALEERLDLQEARLEIARICGMLGLKQWWTYTQMQGGFSGKQDTDGTSLFGMALETEIPLFNYGQAARLRLFAELRQAQNRLEALEIQVLSEVRQAHKIVMSEVKILDDYRDRLLPMQSRITESSEELYNVMALGVDVLIENKRQEMIIYENYAENLKSYFMACVNLDRALGGYLCLTIK